MYSMWTVRTPSASLWCDMLSCLSEVALLETVCALVLKGLLCYDVASQKIQKWVSVIKPHLFASLIVVSGLLSVVFVSNAG